MTTKSLRINAAQTKKSPPELLGRVAYGRETITIVERGCPMARLVPVTDGTPLSLADVKGWLDERDPILAGDLLAHLWSIGKPIEVKDVLIGASALSSGFTTVTNNANHFRRTPGLKVEAWLAA